MMRKREVAIILLWIVACLRWALLFSGCLFHSLDMRALNPLVRGKVRGLTVDSLHGCFLLHSYVANPVCVACDDE
jgi:hypothetical protein